MTVCGVFETLAVTQQRTEKGHQCLIELKCVLRSLAKRTEVYYCSLLDLGAFLDGWFRLILWMVSKTFLLHLLFCCLSLTFLLRLGDNPFSSLSLWWCPKDFLIILRFLAFFLLVKRVFSEIYRPLNGTGMARIVAGLDEIGSRRRKDVIERRLDSGPGVVVAQVL